MHALNFTVGRQSGQACLCAIYFHDYSKSEDVLIQASAEERQGAKRWVIQEIFRTGMTGVILFGMSRRFDWPGAWIILALYLVWITANTLLLYKRSPGLLAERAKKQRSAMMSDTIFLAIYGFAVISKYLLAGLQVYIEGLPRWDWQTGMVAILVAIFGYGLVTWSMWANAYFSMVVRLQQERSQCVVDQGPYRFVRHPGYTGSAIFDLATPFILGSSWALYAGIVAVAAIIVRAVQEDNYLQKNLDGYKGYMQKVQSRLIPWVF